MLPILSCFVCCNSVSRGRHAPSSRASAQPLAGQLTQPHPGTATELVSLSELSLRYDRSIRAVLVLASPSQTPCATPAAAVYCNPAAAALLCPPHSQPKNVCSMPAGLSTKAARDYLNWLQQTEPALLQDIWAHLLRAHSGDPAAKLTLFLDSKKYPNPMTPHACATKDDSLRGKLGASGQHADGDNPGTTTRARVQLTADSRYLTRPCLVPRGDDDEPFAPPGQRRWTHAIVEPISFSPDLAADDSAKQTISRANGTLDSGETSVRDGGDADMQHQRREAPKSRWVDDSGTSGGGGLAAIAGVASANSGQDTCCWPAVVIAFEPANPLEFATGNLDDTTIEAGGKKGGCGGAAADVGADGGVIGGDGSATARQINSSKCAFDSIGSLPATAAEGSQVRPLGDAPVLGMSMLHSTFVGWSETPPLLGTTAIEVALGLQRDEASIALETVANTGANAVGRSAAVSGAADAVPSAATDGASGHWTVGHLCDEAEWAFLLRAQMVLSGLSPITTAINVDDQAVVYQNEASVGYFGRRMEQTAVALAPPTDLPPGPDSMRPQAAAPTSPPDTVGAIVSGEACGLLRELFRFEPTKLERMLSEVFTFGRLWRGIVQVPASCSLNGQALNSACTMVPNSRPSPAAAAAAAARASRPAVDHAPAAAGIASGSLFGNALMKLLPSASNELFIKLQKQEDYDPLHVVAPEVVSGQQQQKERKEEREDGHEKLLNQKPNYQVRQDQHGQQVQPQVPRRLQQAPPRPAAARLMSHSARMCLSQVTVPIRSASQRSLPHSTSASEAVMGDHTYTVGGGGAATPATALAAAASSFVAAAAASEITPLPPPAAAAAPPPPPPPAPAPAFSGSAAVTAPVFTGPAMIRGEGVPPYINGRSLSPNVMAEPSRQPLGAGASHLAALRSPDIDPLATSTWGLLIDTPVETPPTESPTITTMGVASRPSRPAPEAPRRYLSSIGHPAGFPVTRGPAPCIVPPAIRIQHHEQMLRELMQHVQQEQDKQLHETPIGAVAERPPDTILSIPVQHTSTNSASEVTAKAVAIAAVAIADTSAARSSVVNPPTSADNNKSAPPTGSLVGVSRPGVPGSAILGSGDATAAGPRSASTGSRGWSSPRGARRPQKQESGSQHEPDDANRNFAPHRTSLCQELIGESKQIVDSQRRENKKDCNPNGSRRDILYSRAKSCLESSGRDQFLDGFRFEPGASPHPGRACSRAAGSLSPYVLRSNSFGAAGTAAVESLRRGLSRSQHEILCGSAVAATAAAASGSTIARILAFTSSLRSTPSTVQAALQQAVAGSLRAAGADLLFGSSTGPADFTPGTGVGVGVGGVTLATSCVVGADAGLSTSSIRAIAGTGGDVDTVGNSVGNSASAASASSCTVLPHAASAAVASSSTIASTAVSRTISPCMRAASPAAVGDMRSLAGSATIGSARSTSPGVHITSRTMSAPIVASAGAAAGTHAATIAAKPCGRRDAGSAISRTAKSLPSAAKYIFAPLRRRRERKHEAANNVSSSTAAGATCIPGVCITMSGLNSRDNRTNAGAAQPERAPDFRQDQQDQPVEVLQPCTAPQIIPSAKTWDDDSLQSPAHLHGAAMWSDCQAGGGSDGSIGSYIKTPLVADSVPVAVAAAILYPDRPASTGDCGGGGGSGGDGNGDFCTSPAACHSARTSGGGGADRLLRTALHQETCWHELVASVMTDPVTGKDVIILLQTDVTAKVEAERHIALVTQAEHRLLEQIFPRHVLAYMTEEDNSLRACPNSAMGTINLLPAGGSRKSMAAPARDINKLATYHPQVTLLFADIQGFTPMCKVLEPRVVMAFLNDLFTMFDRRLDEFGVYKVETIGDCYFVAGGLIHEDEYGMPAVRARESHADPLHAEKVLMFGKAMLSMAACMSLPTTGGPVKMRIGIHSGPVVSGVVGERMPRFCLFGDTVNTASRMESTGVPGCIHASEAARALLRNEVWVPTGGIEIKGKGLMNTFLWAPPESDSHQALLLFRDLAASHLTLASASSRGGSGWCMECAGPRGRRRNHHRQNQNQNQQQYSRYDAASCAGASASTMQDAITDSTEALKSEAVVDGNVGSGGGNVGSGDGNVGSWGVRCFRCASSRQQQQQQQQQWLLQQMNPRGSAADGTSTSSNSWPEQLYASLAGCSLAGDDDSNLLSLVQLLMPK